MVRTGLGEKTVQEYRILFLKVCSKIGYRIQSYVRCEDNVSYHNKSNLLQTLEKVDYIDYSRIRTQSFCWIILPFKRYSVLVRGRLMIIDTTNISSHFFTIILNVSSLQLES